MSSTSSMFAQILQLVPIPTFKRIVREERGERCAKGFTCRMQLVAMLYLFTYRELWDWLNDPFHTPPLGPPEQLELAF